MTHAGIDRGHAPARVIDRVATTTPELSSYDRRTVGWRNESSGPSQVPFARPVVLHPGEMRHIRRPVDIGR